MLTTAWSPDGRWLAAAGNALNVSRQDPHHHVFLWDAASGELVRQLTQATGAVQSVTWSPDGRRLASGGFDRLVRVWEAASGDLVLTCEGQGSPINAVAWSPDGRWLASGADDAGWIGMEDAVCLWDATTGTLLRRLPGHNRVARAVAWAPEGRRLASAGGDLYAGESYRPEDPDYKIRIWEAATGHLLTALQGHFHEVNALAWSPCGQRLASASSDGSVRVWWVG
jgi:WD40 repeat protein